MSAQTKKTRVALIALGLCLAGCVRGAEEKRPSDAQTDRGGQTASPGDGSSDSVWSSRFPKVLDGAWLVGWTDGIDVHHYSWVRFSGASMGKGVAEFLDGQGLTSNTPYWSCNGTGDWYATGAPDTLWLGFPAQCTSVKSAPYTFRGFSPPPDFAKGAILSAGVREIPKIEGVNGLKFPATQCNADMSSCVDPLK